MRESSIIGEAQSRTLEKRISDNLKDADINWAGITYRKKKTSVDQDKLATYGEDTDINRVLYWLASESGDYGKDNPDKGANLKYYIGKILNSNNLKEWGENLKDRFNDQFSGTNLQIVSLQLMGNPLNKTLYIYFAVYNSMRKSVSKSAAVVSS